MDNKTYWVVRSKLSGEYIARSSCGCCYYFHDKEYRHKFASHEEAAKQMHKNTNYDNFVIVKVTTKPKPKKIHYIVEGEERVEDGAIDCWIGVDHSLFICNDREKAAKFNSVEEAEHAIAEVMQIKSYDCAVYWFSVVSVDG